MDRDHPAPTRTTARSRRGHPRAIQGLTDAGALARAHVTFDVPTAAELSKLKPGDFVKLRRNGERFFVQFTGYEGRKYHGVVANDLELNEDVSADDPIYFLKKNIYCVRRG